MPGGVSQSLTVPKWSSQSSTFLKICFSTDVSTVLCWLAGLNNKDGLLTRGFFWGGAIKIMHFYMHFHSKAKLMHYFCFFFCQLVLLIMQELHDSICWISCIYTTVHQFGDVGIKKKKKVKI